MLSRDSLDFSFSGLKTALLYTLKPQGSTAVLEPPAGDRLRDLACSYQEAAVDVLVAKLARAAARHPVQALCIGGGVARNARLRERLHADPVLANLKLVMPELSLCSDNGAMVASLGSHLYRTGQIAPLDVDAIATSQTGSKAKVR